MGSIYKFGLLLFIASISGAALAEVPPAIYGDDNRQDIYEVTDPSVRAAADSSVALFKFWDLKSAGSRKTDFVGKDLKDSQDLCSGERFSDQLTSPYCSGSLIGDDLVLTAGHCIKYSFLCIGIKVVFGYELSSADHVRPAPVDDSEVYRCSHVVALENSENGPDFAVIRLDRPVHNHTPLKLREGPPSPPGTPVFVIGYPSGLPKKVTDHANIRSLQKRAFVSNLDTFVGNSGSPVFNAETGEVEGVLVSGDDDYVEPKGQSCDRVKVCADDGCTGETATDVSVVLRALQNGSDRAWW